MIAKGLLVFALGGLAFAQSQSFNSCSVDLTKSDGKDRIRISTGISENMIQRKTLPVTTDIDKKLVSTVVVKALIDKGGAVRCAEPVQGDPSLFQRSTDAALQWHFRPFTLNGQALIVETPIEFEFHKGKVKAR